MTSNVGDSAALHQSMPHAHGLRSSNCVISFPYLFIERALELPRQAPLGGTRGERVLVGGDARRT